MRVVLTDKYTDGWINRYVLGPEFSGTHRSRPLRGGWPGCTRGDVTAVTHRVATVPRVNWERLQSGRVANSWRSPSDGAQDRRHLAMYQKITMGGYNEYDLPPGRSRRHTTSRSIIIEPFSDEFRMYGLTITYDMGFAQTHLGVRLLFARRESDLRRF